jgi:hypothetical protein
MKEYFIWNSCAGGYLCRRGGNYYWNIDSCYARTFQSVKLTILIDELLLGIDNGWYGINHVMFEGEFIYNMVRDEGLLLRDLYVIDIITEEVERIM